MVIDFEREPTIGTEVRIDDQRYALASCEPYTRKDGRASFVLTWETHCPVCGELFTIKTGMRTHSFNRRCEADRKACKPVKGKRGRALAISVHPA